VAYLGSSIGVWLMVAAALGLHWQAPADHTLTLLHQAADALGGEATLRSLKAIEMSGVSVWHQREQSERPEGPWVLTFNDFTDVRNLDADAVRRTVRVRGYNTPDWVANKEWTPDTTMVIVSGVGLRQTKDGLQPTDTPWDLGTLPIALDPEHVVIAALDARDVRTETDVALDGYAHRVVSFTYGGYRVKLFLNQAGMLPKAVEITRARPYETYWAPWGDVTQRITFGMWTLEEGGIRFPRLWDYSTGGQPDGTVEITRVVVNPHVAADDFAIPEDLRRSAIANRRAVTDAPFGSAKRPAQQLAEGIIQVPGSWDIVEVRQPDGVVVFEGPMTSSYSVKVLEDVKARMGAPVKAVITTSDSWPHIGGLREYVARGIPIFALDLNVPILERLFAARYETYPDALAKSPRVPVMNSVSRRVALGRGPTRMELIPYRTATAERQMMVYFPEHRLLYTSDLFTIRLPMVFLPQQVAEAVQAVAREHLIVDRAFGMHYDVLPWQVVVDSAKPR
jgi:glyoxylase-like metal-dependent hydrolase (beta-lactamase superfamily II)